jgi:hypothetical protein
MTLSCALNSPDTNWEDSGQTSHHNVHVQLFMQCQPKELIIIYKKSMLYVFKYDNTNTKMHLGFAIKLFQIDL